MRKKLLGALMFFFAFNVCAQDVSLNENSSILNTPLILQSETPKDTLWTINGAFGLSLSQVYLKNWSAGGQSSVTGKGMIDISADYRKGELTWDNDISLAYGMLYEDQVGRAIKTDDKLDLSSKLGHQTSEHWYASALLNFRSQFAPGYVDPRAPDSALVKISDLFSPAYVIAGLGMDYKPNDKLSVYLSPVTNKNTIVLDQWLADRGAFGVEHEVDADGNIVEGAGKNFRAELGAYLKMTYRTPVVENVEWVTKLDLFSNYLDRPENIDVNWENLITMKINSFMSASITTQLIYDHDINVVRDPGNIATDGTVLRAPSIGPAAQFKQTFGLGFSYKF